MSDAIIVHGLQRQEEYRDPDAPSPSNNHWIPWLQKQLLINNLHTHTPEMPHAWRPKYEPWKKEFERFDVTPETILVGHSAGAGFLVRWLSENKLTEVGKVVLVAPSLGVGWDDTGFFDFEIDPLLASRTKGTTIFGSDNDKPVLIETAGRLRSEIKQVKYIELAGYGHFTLRFMGTDRFPALLQEILS